MKKEISEWKSEIKEISLKDAVKEFFEECDYNIEDWSETEENLDYFINDFKEINKEEERLLRKEVKKEFDKKVNKYKQEELAHLKNRKSILNWIKSIMRIDGLIEAGEPGYILNAEEILDLILENGQK